MACVGMLSAMNRGAISDIARLAERSASLQEGAGHFTDHDLYDEDGLPG